MFINLEEVVSLDLSHLKIGIGPLFVIRKVLKKCGQNCVKIVEDDVENNSNYFDNLEVK